MNRLVYITSTKPLWYSLAAALSCSLSDMSSPPLGMLRQPPGVANFFNHQLSTTIHPSYILHPLPVHCLSAGCLRYCLPTFARFNTELKQPWSKQKKWVVPHSPCLGNLTLLTIIQLQSIYPPVLPFLYHTRHLQLTIVITYGIFTIPCGPCSSARDARSPPRRLRP